MSRKTKAAEFAQDSINITVVGRNVTVTTPLKEHAIERILKMEKYTNRIMDVIVTMDVQKLEHRVSIVLQVNHIKIKSHAISEDMYASIDLAVHKLEHQLLRYKGKLQDHHARGVSSVDMKVNVLRSMNDDELIDVNEVIEEENKKRLLDKYSPHKIVSTETRQLKTLTDGEALMKMDLSGDTFLLYRAEDTHRLRVIYRRKDGHFGVLEPS